MKKTLNAVADLDRHLRQSRWFTLSMLALVMAVGLGTWMVLWRVVLPGLLEEGIMFDATVVLMSLGIAWVISVTWRQVWEREDCLMGAPEFSHALHGIDAHPELLEVFREVYETQGKRLLRSQFLLLQDEVHRLNMEKNTRQAEAYVESLLMRGMRTQEAQ